MPDIGKILKEKREKIGKSLDDIHRETRISIAHIQALEGNEFNFLPETYVKSFLKNYADTLGIDSKELLEMFEPPRTENKVIPRGKTTFDKNVANKETPTEIKPPPITKRPSGSPQQVSPKVILSMKAASLAAKPPERKHEPDQLSSFEWALALGGFALFIIIVFAFVNYRTATHSVNPDNGLHIKKAYSELAEVSLQSLEMPDSLHARAPMQLQIQARSNLSVELSIDKEQKHEYNLNVDESMVWLAQDAFKIVLRQQTGKSGNHNDAASLNLSRQDLPDNPNQKKQ